jgi:hypothetical protein
LECTEFYSFQALFLKESNRNKHDSKAQEMEMRKTLLDKEKRHRRQFIKVFIGRTK